MKLRSLASRAVLAVWLVTPVPAGAHRLDEYLQATRLSIGAERVDLEIDLTAGVNIASEVLAWVDTDGDGQISSAEGDAYARLVLQSVALAVDGRPAAIALRESRFPPVEDLRLGVGSIRVRATSSAPAVGIGRHSASYSNTHRSERSVYLVNALVPVDSRIRIAGQRRDREQHGLTLDYDVTSTRWARTYWLFVAVAMAGVLGVTRWPRTSGWS
jgi:hypothetical protein